MKTVLQFSGGRDSLAALFLMEPFWEGITVVWCNSGDSAPELHKLMQKVRLIVPHFQTVEGQAAKTRKDRGDPTPESWIDCCRDSIWMPMLEWVRQNRVRYLIRGTRKTDPVAWPLPNSHHEGVEYLMPLWEWNDELLLGVVEQIRREHNLEPVYPHDCLTCPVQRVCDRPELRNVA